MENFIKDYRIFFNCFFSSIIELFNWLMSTVIGEIIICCIIMGIFLLIVDLIIELKD